MSKRLSVSVPEDLWERVEQLRPRMGPSEIVRLALEQMLDRSVPRFAPSREELSESPAYTATLRRLESQARDAYISGFNAALQGVNEFELGYNELHGLARRNWDIAWLPLRNQSPLGDTKAGFDDLWVYAQTFEEFIDTLDELEKAPGAYYSSPPFVAGRNEAFRMLMDQLGGAAVELYKTGVDNGASDPLTVDRSGSDNA